MKTSIFSTLIILACLIGSACNDDAEEPNPLIGTWEEAVSYSNQDEPRFEKNCYPEGPEAGFNGTWVFKDNGTYRLEFAHGSMTGSDEGLSIGSYDLIADSVLILDIEYWELRDSVYDATMYTTYVSITDTMFIEQVRTMDCFIFWRKVD